MGSCPDTDIDPNFVPNDSVIKRKLSFCALTFLLSCSKASIATTIIIIIIIANVVNIIVTTLIIISLPYSEPFCPCNDHFCWFTSCAKAMALWFALCLFVFSFLVCHFLLLLLFFFSCVCV